MGITRSSRIVALTAAAAIAIGAQALVPRTAVAAASLPTAASNAWLTGNSAGRGLRLVNGGAVADAVGKIFFTLGGIDYVCSGTLVRSAQVTVVLTAAHCVGNGHGEWATNWTFIPGYRDGVTPYGEYTARRFFVSPRWTGPGGNERYDIAFVQVTRATLDGQSRVARVPTGLPITFAKSQTASAGPARTYVFGYPAEPPFSGLYPNYCAGPAAGSATRPGSVDTACTMTAGDSGGPWIAGFSPRAGTPAITAITTYKLSGNLRVLYGTVLGPAARALYEEATATAQPKATAKATAKPTVKPKAKSKTKTKAKKKVKAKPKPKSKRSSLKERLAYRPPWVRSGAAEGTA